jgi:hypothetical protein
MNTTKGLLEKLRIKKGYNLISLPTITLSEEEADRFITYIFDESALKQFARIERMNGPTKNLRAFGFGSGRFLYPASQFNEAKYKKQWASAKIPLATKKVRGAIVIHDDDLEDLPAAMSEDDYKDQMMKIITAKIANELEEICWISETAGLNGFASDDTRGLFDGWRYRITHSATGQAYQNQVTGGAHILNACEGGQTGSAFKFAGSIAEQNPAAPYNWDFKYHGMLKNMPSKYKANAGLKNMAFLNSDQVTQDYLAALSARSTGLGDAVFKGEIEPMYNRVPIIDVPLMSTTLGDPTATPDQDGIIDAGVYTDALLTPKNNLIIGIQRDIRMESKREAADECSYVFYSARLDVALENPDAVVLARCLTIEE